MIPRIDLKVLERVCRVYKSNKDAAAALGVNYGSFARICKSRGVLTPPQKRKAEQRQRDLQRQQLN